MISLNLNQDTYSIGEAAKMIGSTVKTIRYYDEIGLVHPSLYTEGGHRLYTPQDLWRLELITTLRYLNFGIPDIRRLMSGELGMSQALDLQIEALETQISTMSSMLSILQQAKQHEAEASLNSGQSLTYVSSLVDSLTAHAKKRKQFVSAKMEESHLLDEIPQEWRVSFLHFFDKYLMKDTKLSAKQTMAWKEIQEIINDPAYIADLARLELPFFTMANHPQVEADAWVRKMEEIRIRTTEALTKQWPPDSPAVQAMVWDFVMMYASNEHTGDPEAFFSKQARYMLDFVTESILRFNRLCMVLNPEWSEIVNGINLLQEGMRLRLKQMEED
ncbi:MerR family transcriptional regulator [Paenibacillus xylanilyticus]|uniref:MerR family transcriptional regulator n=1 Tax=Paenibacillus xylanilyticus TaxID=248903 RepID=UPI0039A18696